MSMAVVITTALAAASITGSAATSAATGPKEKEVSPAHIVELRQYTLNGGHRDVLAKLFAKEFVSTQEEVGAQVLGTFRDLDDPDRFVWFRGFESMDVRAKALTSFYTGKAWRAHREAANATMLDSDNVLLLRPIAPSGGMPRLALDEGQVLAVWIYYLEGQTTREFAEFYRAAMLPRLEALGVRPLAILETESAANNFPQLPVREGDRVFAWAATFPNAGALEKFEGDLARISGWRDNAPPALLPSLMRRPERLRLGRL